MGYRVDRNGGVLRASGNTHAQKLIHERLLHRLQSDVKQDVGDLTSGDSRPFVIYLSILLKDYNS